MYTKTDMTSLLCKLQNKHLFLRSWKHEYKDKVTPIDLLQDLESPVCCWESPWCAEHESAGKTEQTIPGPHGAPVPESKWTRSSESKVKVVLPQHWKCNLNQAEFE